LSKQSACAKYALVLQFQCFTERRCAELLCLGQPDDCSSGGRIALSSQSFTFIDPAGNQAQYTVYDADRHLEFHWSTDHGDSGFDGSYAAAQNRARTALKASMSQRRRSDRTQP
jgi:hypothetical protein